MSTKKAQVSEKLQRVFDTNPPKNPALSSADKTYLKGLARRGYKQDEIIEIGRKAGFDVKPEDLITKKKAAKVAA